MISWAVFKTLLKKTWTCIRYNWKVPLLIFWSILIYILTRRNTDALKEVIDSNRRAHKEEIELINRVHRDELLRLRKLQNEYKDTLIAIEKEFKKQEKQLSEKQTEDIKSIVIKSKGNPEEIIRKIENDFGIKFKK